LRGFLCERGRGSGLAEDFFQGAAFGEFVDEFVEAADVLHEGVFDVFDADAADEAGDESAGAIEGGGFVEECSEGGIAKELSLQFCFSIAGEPADEGVEFVAASAFFLSFGEVMGVDGGEGHGIDFVFGHGVWGFRG